MSDRRKYLILMGAIVAAFVGAVLLAVPGSPIYKKPTLGLDLRGGLEVVLQAVPDKGQQVTASGMTTAQNIIRSRIDKLGVSEPEVRTQGSNQLVIQLAGVHDPAKAAQLIGKTAQLLIFDFEADLVSPTIDSAGNPTPQPTLYGLLTQIQGQAGKGSPQAYYLFRNKTVTTKTTKKTTEKKDGKTVTVLKPATKTTVVHKLLQGPSPTRADLLKPYGGEVPKDGQILETPSGRLVVSCPVNNGCPGAGAAGTSTSATYFYLFKYHPTAPDGPPALTGKDLVESGISADFDPTTGQPEVVLAFTGHGSHEFQRITKAEYQRGQVAASAAGHGGDSSPTTVQTYAQHNAIVLDGVLESTPYIDYTNSSLADGIAGGATISNMGSIQAAKDLALVLQSGSLPYTFNQIERTDVSATLGKSSLTEAWHAALVGLLVVALFLLVLYRFLGLVAVFGLAIYAALYYAAILLFNVTLTLPGFAGLILTIGVAADANVVVFERIKEEVRAGKSVRAAIAAGYGKGFHTILDANVVTAITAMILFLIAVADVKGFALMLLIGTVISLLTAVAATRAMLGMLSGFRWFGNPKLMGAGGTQTARWLQIDFMRRRYVWFALSGVVILAGVVSLGVRGLNLGIDFKGGTQLSFKTHQAYTQSRVASVVSGDGYSGAVVQGRGSSSTAGSYEEWQIRTTSLKGSAQSALTQDLQRELGAYSTGVKNVSASFGHQIAIDAIWGILVSLALVVVYIALRFDLKFAVPVILAMLHDILVTVGVYSLAFKEVSVDTVAAVLTVLGYSIYDTIIIFDRVRENIPLMRRQSFATIANVSLWETIRRSLATTFITLLPIIALEILGGATLQDFAFALIVGVASGAYSSIFVAAPLLTIWKEREPEYARRKQLERGGDGGAESGKRFLRAKQQDAALAESEAALAEESTPELADVVVAAPSEPGAQARREKRRQRRRSRPHGRAR